MNSKKQFTRSGQPIISEYPFDFCVRLDDLIIGCQEGGDTPEVLQKALQSAIEELKPRGHLRIDNK